MLSPLFTRKTTASTNLSYLTNSTTFTGGRSIKRLFVLIHGWGCPADTYVPFMTKLVSLGYGAEQGVLYAAVDLPGYGSSPQSAWPDPDKLGLERLVAEFVEEVIEDHHQLLQGEETGGGGRVESNSGDDLDIVAFGHSMGTRYALDLCCPLSPLSSHHHVSSVVLLDGSWSGSTVPPPVTPEQVQLVKETVLKTLHTFFGPRTSEEFKKYVYDIFAAMDYDYTVRTGRNYSVWDAERAVKVLRAVREGSTPTETKLLVVQSMEGQGSKEGRRPLRKGEVTTYMRFVRDNAGEDHSSFYVVEDAGHYAHVERPDEVGPVVDEFLKSRGNAK